MAGAHGSKIEGRRQLRHKVSCPNMKKTPSAHELIFMLHVQYKSAKVDFPTTCTCSMYIFYSKPLHKREGEGKYIIRLAMHV